MKTLLFLLTFVLLFTTGCPDISYYEAQWTDNNKDSVICVHYRDNTTNHWVTYYMEYLLFTRLYNQGGYENSYGYYRGHPQEFTPELQSRYTTRGYSTLYSSRFTKTFTTTSRSSISSPRGYSSPARSTSSFHSFHR